MVLYQKHNEANKTIWVVDSATIGNMLFTFDKKKIYNYYKDFPQNLTQEELEIFEKEYPDLKR